MDLNKQNWARLTLSPIQTAFLVKNTVQVHLHAAPGVQGSLARVSHRKLTNLRIKNRWSQHQLLRLNYGKRSFIYRIKEQFFLGQSYK